MFIERGDNLTHGQSFFSDTCITVVFIAFSSHTYMVVYPCHHLSIVLLSDLYVVSSFITNIVVYPCHHLSIVLLSDLHVVLSFITNIVVYPCHHLSIVLLSDLHVMSCHSSLILWYIPAIVCQ